MRSFWRTGRDGAVVAGAVLGLAVPTGPARALDSCNGRYSAAALQPLPVPTVVQLNLRESSPVNVNLAKAFTSGLHQWHATGRAARGWSTDSETFPHVQHHRPRRQHRAWSSATGRSSCRRELCDGNQRTVAEWRLHRATAGPAALRPVYATAAGAVGIIDPASGSERSKHRHDGLDRLDPVHAARQ